MSDTDPDVITPREQDYVPFNDVTSTTQLWECQNCFSIVENWLAHTEWHLRTD